MKAFTRPAKGRVMPRVASPGSKRPFVVCLALLAVLGGGPAVAQPKASEGQPFTAPAVPAAQPATAEPCYAGYGLGPAQKIKLCPAVTASRIFKHPRPD